MAKAIVDSEKCQGCRYCMNACPKDCISIVKIINHKGYEPIQVDLEKCIGCGACYIVCPDYAINILEQEA